MLVLSATVQDSCQSGGAGSSFLTHYFVKLFCMACGSAVQGALMESRRTCRQVRRDNELSTVVTIPSEAPVRGRKGTHEAAQGGAAIAAEVKVFSTFAARAIMEDLVPKFEKASGHKVTSSIANTGGILKRIQDGDISDRNCFCWGLALPIYYGIGPAQESHNRAQ